MHCTTQACHQKITGSQLQVKCWSKSHFFPPKVPKGIKKRSISKKIYVKNLGAQIFIGLPNLIFLKKIVTNLLKASFQIRLVSSLNLASVLWVIFLQAQEGKSMSLLTFGRILLPSLRGSMRSNNPWLSIDFSMTPVETASLPL